MDTKEDQVSEYSDQRGTYIAPQIAILGKVEDLTHGATGATQDLTLTGSR